MTKQEIKLDRSASENLKKKLQQTQSNLSEGSIKQLRQAEVSVGRLQYANLYSNISQTRTKMETTVKKLKDFERAHEEYTQEIERFDRDAAQLLQNVPEIQKLEIHPGWIADPTVVMQNIIEKLTKDGEVSINDIADSEPFAIPLYAAPPTDATKIPSIDYSYWQNKELIIDTESLKKEIEDKERYLSLAVNSQDYTLANKLRAEINILKQKIEINKLKIEYNQGGCNDYSALLANIKKCEDEIKKLQANSNLSLVERSVNSELRKKMDSFDTLAIISEKSSGCVIAAIAMLLRREQILAGGEPTITFNDVLKDNGGVVNASHKTTWLDDFELTHEIISGSAADNKQYIIDLLKNNPAGVIVHFLGCGVEHAVLITDYDSSSGTFYASDSVDAKYSDQKDRGGRMQLQNTWMGKEYAGQDMWKYVDFIYF